LLTTFAKVVSNYILVRLVLAGKAMPLAGYMFFFKCCPSYSTMVDGLQYNNF